MNIQMLYLLILSILGFVSILCFFKIRMLNIPYSIRVKNNRYTYIKKYIGNKIGGDSISGILEQSGFKLVTSKYQIIRYFVFVTWIVLYIFFNIFSKNTFSINSIFLILIFFVITSPKSFFLGLKTPFMHLMDIIIIKYKAKLNIEIYRCILQFKNIAIIKKDNSISSDYVFEQLNKFTNRIKPIFNKMIALWNLGKKEEACSYFESTINTKEAKSLSMLFRKLDDLTPNELFNHISILQDSMRKERETNKLIANENKSNLIYFIVIAASVMVMLNFVVIIYYLEAINNMKFFY